jgi:hypothetical protein
MVTATTHTLRHTPDRGFKRRHDHVKVDHVPGLHGLIHEVDLAGMAEYGFRDEGSALGHQAQPFGGRDPCRVIGMFGL